MARPQAHTHTHTHTHFIVKPFQNTDVIVHLLIKHTFYPTEAKQILDARQSHRCTVNIKTYLTLE
jgi:hypothetical protein